MTQNSLGICAVKMWTVHENVKSQSQQQQQEESEENDGKCAVAMSVDQKKCCI